ncbi:MAG: PAS domain S-box protein, partial [Cyclobacteriaceae bacterium]
MESLRESDPLFVELGQLLSKENLSLFDQVTSELFFIVNPQNGNCQYISKSAVDILGYTNDKLNVSFFLSLIHLDDKSNVLEYYSKCAQEDFGLVIGDNKRKLNCIDFRILHKNGGWIWVALNCVLVSNQNNGLPKVLFGGIRDITKRKEEELCLMHAIRCKHNKDSEFHPSPALNSETHQESFITPREKQI